MSHRTLLAAMTFTALTAAPAAGQMGGAINSSTLAFYQQGNAPNGETDGSAPGTCTFYAANHFSAINFNWWFYRVAGDAVQRPFGTYTKSDGFTISGDSMYPPFEGPTATYHWTETGANGTRFTAVYTTTVSGVGNSQTQANLAQTFQINNPNATALDIVLFNAASLSPGGISSGTVGATGNVNSIDAFDGAYNTGFSAVSASAYQLGAGTGSNNNIPNLYGTPALDLNNSGLPYSGSNFPVAAFEWSLVVPANGSVSVSSSFNAFVAAPEPGSFSLAGFAAALWALRLWRSKRTAPKPCSA